jgi:hypothetical protein
MYMARGEVASRPRGVRILPIIITPVLVEAVEEEAGEEEG